MKNYLKLDVNILRIIAIICFCLEIVLFVVRLLLANVAIRGFKEGEVWIFLMILTVTSFSLWFLLRLKSPLKLSGGIKKFLLLSLNVVKILAIIFLCLTSIILVAGVIDALANPGMKGLGIQGVKECFKIISITSLILWLSLYTRKVLKRA